MSHISVVVPVFQAEDTIHELHSRLKKSLELITYDYEIILIDDGSTDKSWEIISVFHKQIIK